MKQSNWKIVSNELLVPKIWRMRLEGNTEGIKPGQFVDIALPGKFLRRPISVCDVEGEILTIIYKVVGEGTDQMSTMKASEVLDILTELGHGYDLSACEGKKTLLIGGGVGVPPLYKLAKELGGKCTVILGFNTASEVFYEEEFRALGCEVIVTTVDGSYGVKGFVTTPELSEESTNSEKSAPYYYCCGPLPMIKAVLAKYGTTGQISMEERMGCGFGICVGCTIETTEGFRRVCKDGPVFRAEILKIGNN